ncbi:MAG: response regulator [Candidatus Omnitrophica bacterium]|nr:response regulator [Candidatus Omnitrophota bacterium]MCB9769316.1 response regulator [Candidatus Omnitrophota bacterium]MCB9783904.1 response regulator [Candidatus Omnitrophota bacterium]
MNSTIKILVIDPDPDVRMTLEYTLGRAGFEVLTAKGGEEGLHKCFSARPRVVLSEVSVGGMTGYELCGKIKGEPTTRHSTKFILLTSQPENKVFLRGPEVCADFFIPKPFNPAEVVADLHHLNSTGFQNDPHVLSLLRAAKRVPTHKESITPGYTSGGHRVVHLNPPDVRYADRMEKKGQSKATAAGGKSAAIMERPQDPRMIEINELLRSLSGSFKETRHRILAVVQYLDGMLEQPPHSRN